MPRSLVQLAATTTSFVAIESPSTAVVRGQFVNSLLRMPDVARSVNTDLDSVTLFRYHDG